MREKLGGVLFVWFLSYESCLGRFVFEKNSLKVISPDSLKNVYDSAIGYFGVPDQYGGTLTGAVIYPKANKRACKPFTDVDISIKAGDCPIIILADRGECYLTLKVWNAKNAGAAAILIADDRFEPLIVLDTPEEVNPRAGYFPNITIPSAIVSKALGDSMKKALANSEMVNLNLRLETLSQMTDELQ